MKAFKTIFGKNISLPAFFPDATWAVIRTLDSQDIETTKTPGVLVNAYHLYQNLDEEVLKKHGGIREFMSWPEAIISDSGGFQVMSLAKRKDKKGKVTDQGVIFYPSKNKRIVFTPEKSIRFQLALKTDLVIALDDFTPPKASRQVAQETVRRTLLWAQRSKKEFDRHSKGSKQPYLLAVVQGGDYLDLRKKCAQELVKMGFAGLGYGGWPKTPQGKFNYAVAKTIAKVAPQDYFLFGLGIGKPEEIVGCAKLGFHLFDCVLPTRDARHRRLYVYQAKSIDQINLQKKPFYTYFQPDKEKHRQSTKPISHACDCLLCQRYTRGYLAYLFKAEPMTARRLATIHNLRFYSLLMEKIRES